MSKGKTETAGGIGGHARAVVIGGGVVGASTLYHLARKGWDGFRPV